MAAKKPDKAAFQSRPSHPAVQNEGQPPQERAADEHPQVDSPAFPEAGLWDRTFDAIPDLVAIVDIQHRIVRVNKAMADRLGLTKDQCVGQTCYSCVHATDEPPSFCPHSQLLNDGQEHTVEVYEERLAGNYLLSVSPLRDSAGNLVGSVHIARNITDRKRAEEALVASEVRYRRLFETAKDGILILDAETGAVHDVNPFLVELLGYSREEFLGKRIWELGIFKDVAANQANFAELQRQEYIRYEDLPLETADGRRVNVEFVSNVYLVDHQKVIQCNIRDITERRITQSERAITIDVLRLIGQSNSHHALLSSVTEMVRVWAGCDAVGVRLREGEDFPYFETRGFPPEFVLAENHLCEVDARGEVKRDSVGNPVLECMCGNIIRGRFDPSKPFFTAHGSFWTNSTTELLASTTEADRQARTRNRCNGEGYESVALIPLRASGETFGLLQLNDRRRGLFTARRISLFERLADSVALGLAHRKSQEALHLRDRAINAAGEGICVTGPNETGNTLLYVNHGFELLTGYSAGEVLGQNMRFLQGADTDRSAVDRMRVAIELEQEFTTELLNYRKDGTPFWNQISITPVKDAAGKVGHFVAVLHDATDRKQAVEADRRLALIVESSDDAIIAKTSEGTVLTWNHGAERLYGYSAAEIVGSSFSILVPPESVDELPQILARIGRGERIAHYETTRIGKDGRRIQVSLTISPLTDAHGNIVGASTIARDITDRKRAEDEVRKEKDYTQSIIRSMADMLVVVSPDGTIVTVNETTCRSLGYLEEDLIGQPATLLFVEEEEEEEEDNPQLILSQHALPVKRTVLRRLVKQGSVRNIEKSLQTKGGDWIPVLLSGAVIRDDEGEIRGIVCVALDITERRRVEEALRASERFVQGILRAAPNLIYIYDLQDRCNVYTNRSSLDFLGYTPEDIRTMGPALFQTILHPDDANRVAQHHARLAMGDAEVFEIEYRMRHASGQWRWLRSCDVLFARSERGLARQILGFAEDITERKRAEDSLRESEERFRSLIESAPEAIFVQSAGRFDYLNPAACRLLGASRPEDLLGKKFMERMVPEYRDAIRERVRLQRATGMLSPLMEQEYLRLDGSRVPVETTAVSIRYPGEDAHLVFVRDITERKRAEEALRESEERFRRTFDQAPIGAAIVSLDYRFVRVNEAMCRITGYSAEELTTLTFRDITHPDDLAADLKQVRQLVNGAIDQYVTEKRYIRKSGDIVWGHLSVRLLRNATGQPLYFLPMVQDITERRQVDAALSESEERLRLASQSAGIGIWEWHPDTGDVHWSEHVPAVVGVPAAYFKGGNVKALDDLLHPDERPGFWKAFQEAIDSRSRFDREFRIVLPDGKTRWLENLAHMYYDDAGKPLKMIGTVTDITARKRAEEALRESEAKYRNLVETTHDLVWALDTDGRVTFINQAAEQVYGRLPKELLGHSFFDFIVPEEREKTRAGFQAAVAAGQGAQDAECEVLHADGTRRLLLAKSIILRDHQGRVVGFFGTSQDITERRQAEERLAALEIQLTHASRLATLGELAAGIAHEVNQPLCAIVNFAKACKNTASHEAPDLLQIREWCDSIAMAAARSGDIIRGMLGYARRHGSTRETVAIGQLVTDAMRLVRHETQTRKVALQQEMPGQGLAACVDPVQIHQVLVNLLRNAIEALGDTRPADRRVVVQARWVDGLVQVSVSDNGSGQPDAELPKMFEPFFTTKAQGLGMGLAISKTIIEDHGGRIWAEVNQSGGLTIHFTLPAGKDKPQDVPKQNGVCD